MAIDEIHRHPACSRFRAAMEDLKIKQSYVIYPGAERFSLGDGVTAMPLGALTEELAA